ncbi:MAG: hypothetical protein H6852_17425 [Geminicoccaceae bacterium]|jgi:hypothetical protein|nr:hypothetical protein [Geminicoccaceae bacterium]MCB9969402.1 hypothetical protein [Geminicoccaceae bacterium]HRY26215.1 hypothetical protein [Geminicoccaceae bacterium]
MSAATELTTALAAARRSLAGGGLPDIEGLAGRLASLLAEAGRSGRSRDLVALIGLLDEVARLGEALSRECSACRAELARGDASARATAAYHNRARS